MTGRQGGAVHAWQSDVAEHDVDLLAREQILSRLGRLGAADIESRREEHGAQRNPEDRVVLDDENPGAGTINVHESLRRIDRHLPVDGRQALW
jgi:hypothetical protein